VNKIIPRYGLKGSNAGGEGFQTRLDLTGAWRWPTTPI